jgi:hypothetical protein
MEENNTPPKKRKAATKTQIGKELKEIYASGGEDGEDVSTIVRATRVRRWPKFLIAGISLFLLAGIAWLGIARFGGQTRYGDDIDLAIEGPSTPRSGEAMEWSIHYRNDERLPLARASLSVHLPSSFTVIASEPALSESRSLSWNVGTLAPGESGTVKIKARVLDAVDSPLAVQAVLSYRPSNFNADFQKVANWSSRIADSAIELKLEAPEETVPGDNGSFKLTLARREGLSADASVPELKIRFDPDRYIVLKSVTPAFSSVDQRAWTAEAPGAKPLVFDLNGSFATNVSGDAAVRAEAGTIDANGNFLPLASASASVKVMPGDFSLSIVRNGSATDSTVSLGGSMHISVDYENKGSKPITDGEIALTLAGTPTSSGSGPIDWNTWNDLRSGKRSGSTVTWTKKEVPELGSIAPGAKGSIDVSVKATGMIFTLEDRDYRIDLLARGTIGAIGGKKSGKTVSTPVMRTLVNTDASVAAAVRHTEGPLPPKSGEQTVYRILFAVTNSLHEISGIKTTAKLAPGVSFAANGNVDAGDLRFDPADGSVTWTLNRLPTSVKSVSADFTVTLTPKASDIGKSVDLIGNSVFTATDTATGASLTAEALPLDTASVQGGPDNAGIVQE